MQNKYNICRVLCGLRDPLFSLKAIGSYELYTPSSKIFADICHISLRPLAHRVASHGYW